MNTISSSSPPDISALSLSPHRQQHHHEAYDYEQHSLQRPQYNYQSSPPLMPINSPYSINNPANLSQTPLRQSKPARAGLPTQWLDNQGPPLAEGRSLSPYQMSDLSSGGGSPPPMNGLASQAFQSPPQGTLSDDDIIPNAIVIKNIPFNVRRETLLDIITSLNIPTPYAFNYHLDQAGAFRGLAFANFRAPEDADAVVVALNGFDVQGRKLRVEYKKVLQAGEKERIEREKALRRMRSMQLEKERHTLQTIDDFNPQGGNLYSGSQLQSNNAFSNSMYQQQTSPPPQIPPASSYLSPASASTKVSASNELDMNDPATLEIYSRILLFKDDPMRDELAFSRALTPKQRRIVHLIAQKLGVYHYSVGESDERYAVVTRIDPETNQRTVPQRHTSQTLSRATSSYLQSAISSEHSSGLRSKKSMPDMKTLHTTTPRLGIRASNSNLREGYATIASPSRRQNGGYGSLFGTNGGGVFGGGDATGIPPVPSLPSNLSSFNLGGNEQSSSNIVRQPRGPGEGGFTLRRTSGLPIQSESNNSGGMLDARSQADLEI